MKSGQIVEGPDGILYRPLVEKPKTVELKTVAETAVSLPEETRESVRVNVEKSVADGDSPNFAIEREVQKVENEIKERKARKPGPVTEASSSWFLGLADTDPELWGELQKDTKSLKLWYDALADFGTTKLHSDYRQSFLAKPQITLKAYIDAWRGLTPDGEIVDSALAGKLQGKPVQEVIQLAYKAARAFIHAGVHKEGLRTDARRAKNLMASDERIAEQVYQEAVESEGLAPLLERDYKAGDETKTIPSVEDLPSKQHATLFDLLQDKTATWTDLADLKSLVESSGVAEEFGTALLDVAGKVANSQGKVYLPKLAAGTS
jgi:hypothetical protein